MPCWGEVKGIISNPAMAGGIRAFQKDLGKLTVFGYVVHHAYSTPSVLAVSVPCHLVLATQVNGRRAGVEVRAEDRLARFVGLADALDSLDLYPLTGGRHSASNSRLVFVSIKPAPYSPRAVSCTTSTTEL